MRALLAVAVIALVLPASAWASFSSDQTLSSNTSVAKRLTLTQVVRARRMARARWGPSRCPYGISYRYSLLAFQTLGEANWWFYKDSPRVYRGCEIVLAVNPRRVPTLFYHYCAIIFHEYGHLAGHEHSRNPYNVMYPVLTRKNVPRACR